MKTGELASKAGVNKETIRFYENKGLLPNPLRTDSGYRLYENKDVERLIFIKNAKELGFALSEIKELLAIADGNVFKCCDVRIIAENKLEFIENQIQQLTKLKKTLSKLVITCKQSETISDCPIIESLSKGA